MGHPVQFLLLWYQVLVAVGTSGLPDPQTMNIRVAILTNQLLTLLGLPPKRVAVRAADPERVPLGGAGRAAPDGARHRLRRLEGVLPAAEESPLGTAVSGHKV